MDRCTWSSGSSTMSSAPSAGQECLTNEVEDGPLAVAHLRCRVGGIVLRIPHPDIITGDFEAAMRQQTVPYLREQIELVDALHDALDVASPAGGLRR